MFQKLFGGAKKNDSVLSSNTNRTVDAIQKLAEVSADYGGVSDWGLDPVLLRP
jgi:hypothetical protein